MLAGLCAALLLTAVSRAGEPAAPAEAPRAFRFRGGEAVLIILPADALGSMLFLPNSAGAAGASVATQGGTQPVFQQLVTSDGFVSLPGLGLINIKGKTLQEAIDVLAEKLRAKTGVKEPQISFSVLSTPPRRFYVMGEVLHPAPQELPGEYGLSVAAAISMAGGPTEGADTARVRVVRDDPAGGRKTQIVDLSALGKNHVDFLGPTLQEGDVVFVPRAETYSISGEVGKPGVITRTSLGLSPDVPVKLSHVLAAAQGPRPSADMKCVGVLRIGHDGKLHALQCDQTMNDATKEPAQDVELTDGDRVVVNSTEGILVVGRVRLPGIYPAPAGSIKISRLIVAAGGFDLHAKKTAVSIMRKDKAGQPEKVDVRAILEEGRVDKDPLVYPGDIVYVSESVF